jgi:dTDP-4-amino-4,6-dideoxygalactose transaminase
MENKRIFLSPPHLAPDTSTTVAEAIASNYVAYPGPQLTEFENAVKAFTGAQSAAAMASGTAALHVALLALGIGKGDTVLTSDLTFIGSVNPIAYCGAEAVFIDSEPKTWNMDPALFAEAVEDLVKKGKKPKAAVVVHLYGLPADIDPILAVCEKYGIILIEDAAEAMGTFYKGRHVGNQGLVGCFSFNGNKIITTGGGGMVVSVNKALVDKMVFLATQAREAAPFYLHTQRGYNYRMSNILAAVGVSQMRVLDSRVQARRANFEYYKNRIGKLPGVTMMPDCAELGRATYWLTCIVLDPSFGPNKPEEVRQALEKENIESRRIWKPMHTQPIFNNAPIYGGSFDESLFDRGLCLPSGSSMTESDLDRTSSALEKALR